MEYAIVDPKLASACYTTRILCLPDIIVWHHFRAFPPTHYQLTYPPETLLPSVYLPAGQDESHSSGYACLVPP